MSCAEQDIQRFCGLPQSAYLCIFIIRTSRSPSIPYLMSRSNKRRNSSNGANEVNQKGGRPFLQAARKNQKKEHHPEYEGVAQMTRDGNLFVKVEELEDDVFISKELLLTALDAGSVLAREEIEQEARLFANQDKEHELICRRPLSAQSFEKIKERIEDFDINTDDFLKISFLNEEDTLFAQVLRSEDGRHLSFGMDMSAWSWDEPLILGKSMPTGDAVQLLRRVCVYCEDPSSMKEVESFKRM